MKLEVTETSLVDILVVGRTLAEDEIEQIEAFGGFADPEALAMSLYQRSPYAWTLRDADTKEPMVVGGFLQNGATSFRSYFLANPRVWEEAGSDVTKITAEIIEGMLDGFPFVRLETVCLASRPAKVMEWYEKLGLTKDAELDGYGVHGQPAVLYSIVGKKGNNVIELATADQIQVN